MTISEFRKAMRNGPYAWPGCYTMYFVVSGSVMSFAGARQERRAVLDAIARNPETVHLCVNWEDSAIYCDVTDARIPSAYGED